MTLVLCSPDGRLLGALPPFDVASPWWPDVEPVVAGAQARFKVRATVLRVLRTTGRGPDGGAGVYLAETPDAVDQLEEPDAELRGLARAEHALRQPWARPGGPAADVAWADERLAAAGRPRSGHATQVKSWNLSCVLRLPTVAGAVWCKHVPAFLGHEGGVLEAVGRDDPDLVPEVLARRRDADGTSVTLLADVPGVDQWEAPEPVLATMARRWVGVQARWAVRMPELLALGVPDQRSTALAAAVAALVRRPDVRATLDGPELEAVDAVVAALPDRLAALEACGLPATLVHGDLHPGNWIGDGRRLVLVDWGDSVVGTPDARRPGVPRAGAGRPGARPGPGRRRPGVGAGGAGRRSRAGDGPRRPGRRAAPRAGLPPLPRRHRGDRTRLPRAGRPRHAQARGGDCVGSHVVIRAFRRARVGSLRMLITTANELPGYDITQVIGEVFGLTVRSRNIGSQLGAGLKSLVGGELRGMTTMLAQGRQQAIDRLVEETQAKGGNAIVAMRFDTSEFGGMGTEICAYGTAVVAQPAG